MATSEREACTACTKIPRWGPIFPLRGRYPCLLSYFVSRELAKPFEIFLVHFCSQVRNNTTPCWRQYTFKMEDGKYFENVFPVRIYMVWMNIFSTKGSTCISSCKSAWFVLCLFICFSQESQPEGHFILITYLQSFPTPSKLLRLPTVTIHKLSSALLTVHCRRPLELDSEVWHISLQVLKGLNKKECGTR